MGNHSLTHRIIAILTILLEAVVSPGMASSGHPRYRRHLSPEQRVMAQLMALPSLYPRNDEIFRALREKKPLDFYGQQYLVDPYVRAAVALQGLGRVRACRLLLRLSATEGGPTQAHGDGYQPVVLCRMLFTAKPGGRFERPPFGLPGFLGRTGIPDWPLEPIALVDGVPFLVCTGYTPPSVEADSGGFVLECLHDDAWNPTRYRLKSSAEERAALQDLLSSPVWHGSLRPEDRAYLAAQLGPNVKWHAGEAPHI